MKKIRVRVKTGQLSNEVVGLDSEGILVVRVKARPHRGQANRGLVELLAEYFSVPKSRIEIVKGAGSTLKLLEVPDDLGLESQPAPPRGD